MSENIHKPRERLKKQLPKPETWIGISKRDKKLILDFHDECYSQALSDHRVLFYVTKLRNICKWKEKHFDHLTKADIKDLVRKIQQKEYAEWTKHGHKVTIKKFFQWLKGYEWHSKQYPEEVRWIKAVIKNNKRKLPEEMLSRDEIKKLMKTACGVRDKAFVSVLHESGCRIGEMLGLRLKHVEFDEYGAVIRVHGKTGSRRVRLVSSVPHLANWIEHHPRKENEYYLWINVGTTNHGERMGYQNARKLLKLIARKAGIEKAVNPQAFREARATHLANNLTEAQMCEYFGWVQASKMPSIYVHLSGRDVDNAILRIHGKLSKDEEKKEEELKTRECPRCYHENSPEARFCNRCRLPLDEKTALELEKRKKEFTSIMTPDIIEKMIEEKVRQMLKSRIS